MVDAVDNLERVYLAVMVWKSLFVAGKDDHQHAAVKEGFLVEIVDNQGLLAVVMDRNFLVVAVVVGQHQKLGFLVVVEVDTILTEDVKYNYQREELLVLAMDTNQSACQMGVD